jgi:hypothetical protein
MIYDDDGFEVLDEVRLHISRLEARQSKSGWLPFLHMIEDHIYACHEMLAFARDNANYQESQQWRDWANRLDIILPEIRRYDW